MVPKWVPRSALLHCEVVISGTYLRNVDELQAADIAAGWARELIDIGDTTHLGSIFERVWVKGKRTK